MNTTTWNGRIAGSPGSWGSAEAPLRILVDDALTPLPLPSELLPPKTAGDHIALGPLGALGAQARLALLGFQHLNPHWDGIAIHCGAAATHWATLSAREVIHLTTSAAPALALALSQGEAGASGPDEQAGDARKALDAALDRPEKLLTLLGDLTRPAQIRAALAGADVGASRTLWLGQQAVLIGDGPLVGDYARALQAAHVPVILTDHTALLQKGFEALATRFTQPD